MDSPRRLLSPSSGLGLLLCLASMVLLTACGYQLRQLDFGDTWPEGEVIDVTTPQNEQQLRDMLVGLLPDRLLPPGEHTWMLQIQDVRTDTELTLIDREGRNLEYTFKLILDYRIQRPDGSHHGPTLLSFSRRVRQPIQALGDTKQLEDFFAIDMRRQAAEQLLESLRQQQANSR